jgi:hypothetical protein
METGSLCNYSQKRKGNILVPLLPCIAKIMESAMAKRIENAAIRCGALSPNHMGGISQTSAIDAVIGILNHISNTLTTPHSKRSLEEQYRTSPSILGMDIQGAFNAISTKILGSVMAARKMSLYQIKWVEEMGQHHQLSFSFDDKTESPKQISEVLLQGSPSSSILFAIMAAIMEIPPQNITPPFGFGKHEKPHRILSSNREPPLPNAIDKIIC